MSTNFTTLAQTIPVRVSPRIEPTRIRTLDPQIKSLLLYQLSYRPSQFTNKRLRSAGIEPATYGFEVRRSIQLSYERSIKGG